MNTTRWTDEKEGRYVHRLACDVFHARVQFKLERSDELEEEGFHPVKRGEVRNRTHVEAKYALMEERGRTRREQSGSQCRLVLLR